MNYKEIASKIEQMTEEQKNKNTSVYIYFEDNYPPIERMDEAGAENNIFDEGHPYFIISK